MGQNLTTTVVSLVFVFVLSSTLFLIIGCVCGWYCHKHKRSDKNNSQQAAPPLYEDLRPKFMPECQGKVFVLKENVAYGPVHARKKN